MTTKSKQSKASEIPAKMIFGADVDSGPFEDEVDWIKQYYPEATESGYYIVEGDETFPTRIWHGQENNVSAVFTCVYEDEDATRD